MSGEWHDTDGKIMPDQAITPDTIRVVRAARMCVEHGVTSVGIIEVTGELESDGTPLFFGIVLEQKEHALAIGHALVELAEQLL